MTRLNGKQSSQGLPFLTKDDETRAQLKDGEIKMADKKAKTDDKEKKAPKVKFSGFAPLKFKDFTITQKRSGRFEVINAKGKNINGGEKVKILTDAKVLKESVKKAPEAAAT